MAWWGKLLTSINRKKTLDDDMMETPLRRCLSTVDLTLWGIGHMVGAGIYVITGKLNFWVLTGTVNHYIKHINGNGQSSKLKMGSHNRVMYIYIIKYITVVSKILKSYRY